jgi:hypothetical protein
MLKYIGDGTQLLGVPTRDLTDDEVKAFGLALLLSSGLYQEIEPPKKAEQKVSEVSK